MISMGISQRIRWHVFQRDNFTCRYCGRNITHPDVVLEIDHIKPLSKGGTDELDNLATACFACNHGKHADRVILPAIIKENNSKKVDKVEKNIKTSQKIVNFFQFKDFDDFIKKMGFTIDEGIEFLDDELKKRGII